MSFAKLTKFVETRNASPFASNLQFQIDLEEAGLTFKDIGQAYKVEAGGYRWDTPWGRLYEEPDGQMRVTANK